MDFKILIEMWLTSHQEKWQLLVKWRVVFVGMFLLVEDLSGHAEGGNQVSFGETLEIDHFQSCSNTWHLFFRPHHHFEKGVIFVYF